MRLSQRAKVSRGNLIFLHPEAWEESIRHFTGEVVVSIEPYSGNRTSRQNNYYWGVVVKMLSDEIGYYPKEMHEELKKLFTPHGTTSKMSTIEFEDYTNQVRDWAMREHNINIPTPA